MTLFLWALLIVGFVAALSAIALLVAIFLAFEPRS